VSTEGSRLISLKSLIISLARSLLFFLNRWNFNLKGLLVVTAGRLVPSPVILVVNKSYILIQSALQGSPLSKEEDVSLNAWCSVSLSWFVLG
jgi:hypothetical protein